MSGKAWAPTWGYSPYLRKDTHYVNNGGYGDPGVSVPTPEGYHGQGSIITVHVDMDEGTLAYSVDGEPVVDAGVRLPGAVRPWAQVWYKGESVSLLPSTASRALPSVRKPEEGAGEGGAAGGSTVRVEDAACASV